MLAATRGFHGTGLPRIVQPNLGTESRLGGYTMNCDAFHDRLLSHCGRGICDDIPRRCDHLNIGKILLTIVEHMSAK
jgi:hypothetical protein